MSISSNLLSELSTPLNTYMCDSIAAAATASGKTMLSMGHTIMNRVTGVLARINIRSVWT
jgi:hypothetical protein